jgi:hypothetical protein
LQPIPTPARPHGADRPSPPPEINSPCIIHSRRGSTGQRVYARRGTREPKPIFDDKSTKLLKTVISKRSIFVLISYDINKIIYEHFF